MNKLLLNCRSRNHIRFLPAKEGMDLGIPTDDADKIKWCEDRFNQLQHRNDITRLCFYSHTKKGYLITVYEMDNLYYLVLCIRNEFRTYNTTIYIDTEKEQLIGIAKFLDKNNSQIMKDYKNQILEARDALMKAKAEEQADGDA